MATTQAPDGTEIHFEATGPGDAGAHDGEPGGASGPSGDGAAPSQPPTAVVLVHGITENHTAWEPVVERLSATRPTVALDLRGHGRSDYADRYDLEAMASDVAAVIDEARLERPHLVGHSLGGAVVSVVGATIPVSSVVNVDQSLQLSGFSDQLITFENQLRNPDTFPVVVNGLFETMYGDLLADSERARLDALRRLDPDVVLGVWEMLLTSTSDDVDAAVDAALSGYRDRHVDYLLIHGIDPGTDGTWLAERVDGAVTEVWEDHGHYPHLVDPDRFVERLERFWS
ncbi:alpha/beta fold hydrolase [Ilumatobacter sp.]|uniref:alpha/beta fold hydrolase n=1 Tax=Ilumatobacter sp. TaxID=1967498 RepID=UPI003B529D98